MTGVDDSIVSIKFDNQQFEKRVSDTIASLDKLRASLDFANSTRGMNDLNTAAKNFDMSHIGVNLESVSAKFLALGTVAVTVLSNITTKAIAMAGSLVSSLTLDPVMAGFQEYETNMNSIQTILANTRADGTNLEQVNAALDQLNQYSDQTIYNFSEMARNIGTFTAAGVALDTAVPAIKGIANLAAISGSNSEQASTAMYQLSQAISSGSVKLMDWNSIVNAGMGGEVFQKALFETGKMMGTIADTDMSTTFEEWTAAGNTFRGSLEEGWLTADVLTNTLQGFTGDLTEAQILSMGYTQEQAAEIMALGASGKAAATEVKTLTQLMGTVKESIASGWSSSFRLIFGNFEEAKATFTEMNNTIGGFVGRMSDARNSMLETWRFFGGREKLIQGLKDVFNSLLNIIVPIKNAFREIFPPATGITLIVLTQRFGEFAARLRELTTSLLPRIQLIFKGFFATIEIGWEILKNLARVIGTVIGAIGGAAGGPALGFFETIASKMIALNELLVEGGGITDFFNDMMEGIGDAVQKPIEWILKLKDAIVGFFSSAGDASSDVVGGAFGRVGDRVESVTGIWDKFVDGLGKVGDILADVWDAISSFFGELGSRIASVMSGGDFSMVTDALSVGLLGGIALMIRRFLRGGINIDFGGGILQSLRETFEGLTSTLSAMQAQIQSKTLINIAIAVAVLTASVLVLSLIDSAALARSLAAMSVGLGELMLAMRLLSSGQGPASQGRIAAMAFSLILLSGAVLVLSIAMRNMASMDAGELAAGLAGISAGLAALVTATRHISEDRDGMIGTAIAMIAMSVALMLLSIAVKMFAGMSMAEMGQGMLSIGIGLTAIVLAINQMPARGMLAQGLGMIALAISLQLLAGAIREFATIGWAEMAHGLVGIGATLLIIAGAMRVMPQNMPAIALGVALVGASLYVLALAVGKMAELSFGEMAKAIGGFAVMLLVLAVAMNAMQGAIGGAVSIIIISAALMVLVQVLKVIGGMSIAEIAIGIGAIAAVLLVLGIAAALMTPVLPSLFALGVALALIGVAFALFGAGAFLAAKAFELVTSAGQAGINTIIEILHSLAAALPELMATFVLGLIDSLKQVVDAAPMLLDSIKALLIKILDTVIEIVPKIGEVIGSIVSTGLGIIREKFPEVLATGVALLGMLLTGIRNNIFSIVEAVVNLITAFTDAFAEHAPELVTAGMNVLVAFLNGIAENIHLVTEAVANLIISFITAIAESYLMIIDAGFELLTQFLLGIANNISSIANTVTNIITTFIYQLGLNAQQIIDAGFWLLTTLILGVSNHIMDVVLMVGYIVTTFITEMGNQASRFITAGAEALIDFLDGIDENANAVMDKGVAVAISLLEGAASNAVDFVNHAAAVLIEFLNGMETAIRTHSNEINDASLDLADAILDGVVDGIQQGLSRVVTAMTDLASSALDAAKGFLGIDSPSKEFIKIGQFIGAGLALGIASDDSASRSAENLADRTITTFQDSLSKVRFSLGELDDLNPVITPVLDLTNVRTAARDIDGMMNLSTITPDVSYEKARTIATTTELESAGAATPTPAVPTEIIFNQNNYSPEALSTNDIYRNTKSQIALAKEELEIS